MSYLIEGAKRLRLEKEDLQLRMKPRLEHAKTVGRTVAGVVKQKGTKLGVKVNLTISYKFMIFEFFPELMFRTGCRYRICRNKRPPKTVIFQRGEYRKPMGFDGWFFKGGSTQNRWLLMGFGMFFYCFYKLSAWDVYFGKYGIFLCEISYFTVFQWYSKIDFLKRSSFTTLLYFRFILKLSSDSIFVIL